MEFLVRATRALQRVEAELRAAMSAAIAAQEYKQTAVIAALADSVSSLLRQHAGGQTTQASEPDVAASASTSVAAAPGEAVSIPPPARSPAFADGRRARPVHRKRADPKRKSRRTAKENVARSDAGAPPSARPEGLPRFEREADRLVKIGWSARDHRIYEHKAPRSAVLEFTRLARALAADGRTFTMDDVLPVKNESGKEWPSYQAYLALAWLRALGAIQRVGKDGYTANKENLDQAAVEQYWSSLQTRDARPLMEQQ